MWQVDATLQYQNLAPFCRVLFGFFIFIPHRKTFAFHFCIFHLRYPPPGGVVSTPQTSWPQEEKEKVGGGRRGQSGAGGSPVDSWIWWGTDSFYISVYIKIIFVYVTLTLSWSSRLNSRFCWPTRSIFHSFCLCMTAPVVEKPLR